MKNLDAKGNQVPHVNEDCDPIDIALNKYVDHRTIFKIKKTLMNLLSVIFRR